MRGLKFIFIMLLFVCGSCEKNVLLDLDSEVTD